MVGLDHFVFPSSQKHDPTICIIVYLHKYIQLIGVYPSLVLNIPANCHEKAGKQAMEKTKTEARYHFLGYFLANLFQVGKGRVDDQEITFFAEEGTDCSHASTPNGYLIFLFLEKANCLIDLFCLLLAQRDVFLIIIIPTPSKVKAGQSNIAGQVVKMGKSLITTRGIAVQIENEITRIRRSVDGQGEGDLIDIVLIPGLIFASGVEELAIVDEPRGSDQHEGIFFDAGLGCVPLHFKGPRLVWALGTLIHRQLLNIIIIIISAGDPSPLRPFLAFSRTPSVGS